MTMDDRIEAATEAMLNSKAWPVVFNGGAARYLAQVAILEAFPELFGSAPTHKIVPFIPTAEMLRAMVKAGAFATNEYRAAIEAAP